MEIYNPFCPKNCECFVKLPPPKVDKSSPCSTINRYHLQPQLKPTKHLHPIFHPPKKTVPICQVWVTKNTCKIKLGRGGRHLELSEWNGSKNVKMAFVGANAKLLWALEACWTVSICPAQSLPMDQKRLCQKRKGIFDSRKIIYSPESFRWRENIFYLYIYIWMHVFFLGGWNF